MELLLRPHAIAVLALSFLASISPAVASSIALEFDASAISLRLSNYVKYIPLSRKFEYYYSISMAPGKYETLSSLVIKVDNKILKASHPSGWSGTKVEDKPFWAWIPDNKEFDFAPGASATGLTLESPGLPAVQPFYAQGITQSPTVEDVPEDMTEEDFTESLDVFHNGISGSTIGPSSTDISDGIRPLVLHLRQQMNEVAKYGWIQNSGVLKSLDAKLDSVEKSINAGNRTTASNQLSAFRSEVSALSGKQINPDSASLFMSISDAITSIL